MPIMFHFKESVWGSGSRVLGLGFGVLLAQGSGLGLEVYS